MHFISGPLPRHVPVYRATNDAFLKHLMNEAMFNTSSVYSAFLRRGGSNIPKLFSDEDGKQVYKELSVYAKRLHDLGLKYGVDSGAHFFARWILSLPLLGHPRHDDGKHELMWRQSLVYAMGIRTAFLEMHDYSISAKDLAVVNHAIVTHLCSYGSDAAFYYATHLVADPAFSAIDESVEVSPCSSILPLTWNTLLSTAIALRNHEDIIFTMNAMQQYCADLINDPPSAPEQRLHEVLTGEGVQVIDDSVFADCLYALPTAQVQEDSSDAGLLMTLLRCHIVLNNGEIKFYNLDAV